MLNPCRTWPSSAPRNSAPRGRLDQSPATLTFDALGLRFELELEPNRRLIANVFPDGLPRDVGVYRGRLVGKTGSWARIVIADGVPTGMIWDGTDMLAIESPAGSRDAEIFRLRDAWVQPGMLSCASGKSATTFATAYATITDEIQPVLARAAGAVDEIRIGLVSDFEFTENQGATVQSDMLTRINNVDGIFSDQLGIQITVDFIDVFDTADDPFTTAEAEDLVEELGIYRRDTPAQNSLGLTYMFTGRELNGSTVGIAYRGAICDRQFSASLGEGLRGDVFDSLIAAHEIGHNFGAQHDGEAGSVCESETGDFLMTPSINGSREFSSCSLDTMAPFIAGASCISPLALTGASIDLSGPLPRFFLGRQVDLVFDVNNVGAAPATNVDATFTIPTILAIDSVASTAGTCTSGAGLVNCSIGTIDADSTVNVALSVTPASIGSASLDAEVTADDDANLEDNTTSLTVLVEAATDLRIANLANGVATLDRTVTLSPRIENVSTVDASDVTLTMTFAGGLRVESASWTGGTCSTTNTTVDCQLTTLAAQSDAPAEIRLTAVSTGSQSFTASVASAEIEADDTDNNFTGSISVSEPTSSNSDGGGGGALDLLWLLSILLLRRRASHSP